MPWIRLIVSMILFPISLVWYRRDVACGIPPRVYWPTMAAWVVLNIALSIYAMQRAAELLSALSDGI